MIHRERKNKLKQITHNFTQNDWDTKLKLTKGFCPMCYKYIGINNLTMDHTPALSKVNTGHIYTINYVNPLCQPCNAKKRDRDIKINFRGFLNMIQKNKISKRLN